MDYQPIENYGAIGNMRSLALVSNTGSIDFFCFPRFDSPTLFGALLDCEKGGFYCIQPQMKNARTKQLYLPDTNILLTRFLSDEGIAEMADFMPITGAELHSLIVRRVMVVQGEVTFRVNCHPRFNYARTPHTIEREENAVVFKPEGDFPVVMLQSSIPLNVEGDGVVTDFTLKAGEVAVFGFGEDRPPLHKPLEISLVEHGLSETTKYWHHWSAQSNYRGRWREMVNRSALMLKLLTDRECGSIIAAPTFGLPEKIGGERNWDYRYTWLRDSSFSLYAMMRLGFIEEATAFQDWIAGRLNYDSPEGPLQVLYHTDGSHEIPEETLDHLEGYMKSKPVRIGNAAYKQLQLDIYGELMDAVYLASKYSDGISIDQWNRTRRMLKWLSENWNREDEGIWEVRGGRKHFLHSRLLCWVAFDRAIRLGEKRSLCGPFDWMEKTRDAIVADIQNNFWDEELQSFVQSKGSKYVDASLLLMPLLRFISPSDPKWLSTLKAIEEKLSVDTLVFRYRDASQLDGLEGDEGAFTACSFWFIEALARSHQVEKARLLFEKMLGYANHLGLYSEQLGESGQHLGNFPQALTHLALISAATYLDKALSGKPPEPWS